MRWTLLAILAQAALAAAAPTLVYPLAAQFPPVGRVDKPFDFALLPGTFNSSSTIAYTTNALPSWLTFDPVALSFFGTPASSDLGQTDISVTASDGSKTSDTFTLLVTDAPSPAVHQGIPSQIASPLLHNFATAIALPSNTGVTIHPYYSFSLGFQQSTFRPAYDATPAQSSIYFAAHERGHVVLPSWLTFDNSTVTFYGTAPAEGSYTIVVVGSDFWGYEAVETSFVIEVGTSSVDFVSGGLGNITTVAGAMVEYSLNLTGLAINGQTLTSTADINVQLDLDEFDWLTFDSSILSLSGTTPGEFINGTVNPLYVPVTISTTNGTSGVSSLPVYLPITVRPSLFTTLSLSNATATPGQSFSYSLSNYLRNASNVAGLNTSSTSSSALASWISVDSKSLTLSGTVPNASSLASYRSLSRRANDAQVNLKVAATEAGTGLVSTATLLIDLAGVAAPSSTASSSSPSATNGSGSSAKHSSGLSKAGKIALGVVFGLLGLILLILFLVCCFRRRRSKQAKEERMKRASDGDSFVGIVKSPREKSGGFRFIGSNKDMPRSGSGRLHEGEMPQFSTLYAHRSREDGTRPTANQLAAANGEEPRRMPAMSGILGWDGEARKSEDSRVTFPPLEPESPAQGEIITAGTLYPPSHGGSDFTHDFSSQSESRASWESRGSFHWSSGDFHAQRPASGVPSIPRPRQDFTPRYPRNASPSALAALVRPPSSAGTGHTFSEFNSPSQSDLDDSIADHTHTHSHSGSLSLSGEGRGAFSPGPSGLGRFVGESGHFIPEEDEDMSHSEGHGDAVVQFAERRSVDRRQDEDDAGPSHLPPRLMPSKERFGVSPTESEFPAKQRTPSQEAIAMREENSDAFDDADEEERQRNSIAFAPSLVETDVQGLGYPSSAIYFGSPPREPERDRVSSIRAVPAHDVVLSPPLPQLGNLMQQLDDPEQSGDRTSAPRASMHNGRYIAQTNQNFNLHPHIHPPPVVSLSAATWSSAPPSTYRAEADVGAKPLPGWLHFDTKELELWGIPSLSDDGEVFAVRIIERQPPREKRKSYDSSQVMKDETTEREVARVVIEVVDGVKSPDAFSLDAYASPPPMTY